MSACVLQVLLLIQLYLKLMASTLILGRTPDPRRFGIWMKSPPPVLADQGKPSSMTGPTVLQAPTILAGSTTRSNSASSTKPSSSAAAFSVRSCSMA